MLVVDVNILVYAVNHVAPQHDCVRSWWESALRGDEAVALCWPVVSGFLRVTTRPHGAEKPISMARAIDLMDEWFAQPNVCVVDPTVDHWEIFRGLLLNVGHSGKLTSDAHLAAIAIGNGARLASCDTDFARFQKLRWVNPLAAG